MTASRNKASRAVTAALVGVLSVGAVPMVAVAADSGATTLSVTATDALEGGTLTGAVDIDGNEIEIPATGVITFTADGRPQGVIPTEIAVAAGASTVTVDLNTGSYDLAWYTADDNFNTVGEISSAPVEVGKYVAKLTIKGGDYKGATVSVPFEIVAASLEGVTAVDTVDGSFEFDGTDQLDNIAFELDGKLLYASTDPNNNMAPLYIDQVYKKGSSYDDGQTDNAIDAGEYSVVLVGKAGTIYAGSQTEVQFTVSALDLSKATIVMADAVVSEMDENFEPTILSINGKDNDTLLGSVTSTFKSGPDGSSLVWQRGEYTYTVTRADNDNDNVTGSQDVTFDAVDSMDVSFTYQGVEFEDLEINLGNGESFTPDKIQAFRDGGTELSSGEYTVTATNLLTGEVSSVLSVVNTPGTWIVTAKVNAAATGYTLGGSATMTVTTIAGEITTSANVYYLYDGRVVDSVVYDEYDGTDKLDKLDVVVTDAYGSVLEQGTDYTVTVTDAAGNVLDEVVDAGQYIVKVSSDAYVIYETDDAGASLTLQVKPLEVQDVRVAEDEFFVYYDNNVQGGFLPYTGSAIVPAIEYLGSDDAWHTLPSDLYTLTYYYSADGTSYVKVDDMTAVGYYKVYLHAVRDNDTNWDLATKADDDPANGFWVVGGYVDDDFVYVSDQKVFADVANNEWYSEYVYTANSLGYMRGYADGTFFGPTDSINRADVVMVLWNMAGTPGMTPSEGSTSDLVTYDLPYNDCDEGAYYAQALQWATKVGIVSGDAGSYETFRPGDSVTREELAKMLYVYEEKQGNVGELDVDEILSAYDDEGSVSEWARTYVAYLVDEGVMGVGSDLEGDRDISRAEVAAMVVRIQPDGQLDGFDFLQ